MLLHTLVSCVITATDDFGLRTVVFWKIVFNHSSTGTNILIPADRRTRAKRQFKYRHITAQTPVFKNSLISRTIVDWNTSDAEIVEASSFKERSHLKRHRRYQTAAVYCSFIGLILHEEVCRLQETAPDLQFNLQCTLNLCMLILNSCLANGKLSHGVSGRWSYSTRLLLDSACGASDVNVPWMTMLHLFHHHWYSWRQKRQKLQMHMIVLIDKTRFRILQSFALSPFLHFFPFRYRVQSSHTFVHCELDCKSGAVSIWHFKQVYFNACNQVARSVQWSIVCDSFRSYFTISIC